MPGDGTAPTVTVEGLNAALDRLVDRGVLNRVQAGSVAHEVGVASPANRPEGLRRRLGEIAGYLGASFVIGATLLFLGEEWEALGRSGRVAILAAMAVVLCGAGLAVRWRAAPPGEAWWRPWTGDNVRRRLSSTLITAGAAAAAFAVIARLEDSEYGPLAASATGLAVAALGYLLARSAVGQLGTAVGAFAVYVSVLDLRDATDSEVLGVGMLVLGAIWALATWLRVVTERRFALAIAVTFALFGAQFVVFGDSESQDFLAYFLTALVAAVCFIAYAQIREWVVLAGGVIGATLAVPEFLYDITDGSLGASGVMLVAGVTLLAGSLAGLRIRRTPAVPETGPADVAEAQPGGS